MATVGCTWWDVLGGEGGTRALRLPDASFGVIYNAASWYGMDLGFGLSLCAHLLYYKVRGL